MFNLHKSYPICPGEPHNSIVRGGVDGSGHLRPGERSGSSVHNNAALSATFLTHEPIGQQSTAYHAVLRIKSAFCKHGVLNDVATSVKLIYTCLWQFRYVNKYAKHCHEYSIK